MKKCTIGPKHKWAWLKNISSSSQSGNSLHFSLRGLYKCACGERKLSTPNPNDTSNSDLRDMIDMLATPKA